MVQITPLSPHGTVQTIERFAISHYQLIYRWVIEQTAMLLDANPGARSL